ALHAWRMSQLPQRRDSNCADRALDALPSSAVASASMEFPSLDFSKIRTYPVAERANKVAVEAFAKPHAAGGSFRSFLDGLPDFLAVQDLRLVVSAIAAAVKNRRPVLLMMGA